MQLLRHHHVVELSDSKTKSQLAKWFELRSLFRRLRTHELSLDVHATMWSRWRRQMSDQMCVECTRAMSRIDMSVAKVFDDESDRRLPAPQEEIDKYMVIVPDCNDNDIFEDEPLTKRFRDDH